MFPHTLIGVGPICDANCSVTFARDMIVVRNPQGIAIVYGLRGTLCTLEHNRPRQDIASSQGGNVEAVLPRVAEVDVKDGGDWRLPLTIAKIIKASQRAQC